MALVRGDKVVRNAQHMDRGHAEALFPMIDETLAEAGASFTDLTRIAVCTGPGSFTGIRVGVAAARGLALGLGIPAVGVTRFEALLAAAAPAGTSTVVVPGRGGAAYLQDFSADRVAVGAPREVNQSDLPDGPDLVGVPSASTFADPTVIADIALSRDDATAPAPVYIRGADADPPRDGPPVILD